jgi:predicted O-methyltransferase YrrM
MPALTPRVIPGNIFMRRSKTIQLLSLLATDPLEFRDRALTILDGRLSCLSPRKPSYLASEWDSVVANLTGVLGPAFEEAVSATELADIEHRTRLRMQSLPPDAPFRSSHNGDPLLAKLCYAIVRAVRPKIVLETGVCYGIGSAFTLAALERNGDGSLFSVDLPPLAQNGSRFIGWAIPEGPLKARWHLHKGATRRILPGLLRQLGDIDVFIHDSLHTYRNMKMEFEAVWPHIRPAGILISDDVQGNTAFRELAEHADVATCAVIRELDKDSLFGVIVKAV